MLIEIYSKTNCAYCDKADFIAQAFIQESNHKYTKLMLDKDFTLPELLEKVPGARTFPQIFIDGEAIGGYQEFDKFIKAHIGA